MTCNSNVQRVECNKIQARALCLQLAWYVHGQDHEWNVLADVFKRGHCMITAVTSLGFKLVGQCLPAVEA